MTLSPAARLSVQVVTSVAILLILSGMIYAVTIGLLNYDRIGV